MSATSASRAHARKIAGESVTMIQGNDSPSSTAAIERAHAPLLPTVFRPSHPSVTRVAGGEAIKTEIFRGPALAHAGIDFRDPVREGTEVVAIRVPALHVDDLVELRIPRAYVERASTEADHPAWSATQPANSVMLPHGWLLIESSVATIVSQTGDGRTRIEFDAPDDAAREVVLTVQRT
jgi:hypothetical protein